MAGEVVLAGLHRAAALFFVAIASASCDVSVERVEKSLSPDLKYYEATLIEVAKLCRERSGASYFENVRSRGIIELWADGCASNTCWNALAERAVDFIETEVEARQDTTLYDHMLVPGAGKFRFKVEVTGHENCELFERRRRANKSVRIPLSEEECIATIAIDNFSADYAIDAEFSNSEFYDGDEKLIGNKSRRFILRLDDGETVAENVEYKFYLGHTRRMSEGSDGMLRCFAVDDSQFIATALGAK